MRIHIAIGLFVALLSTTAPAQEDQSTTWFVVRHADRAGEADALTKEGFQRADQLRDLMKAFRVTAIYSTDTQRTRDTAQPTAQALRLPVQTYGKLTAEWFEQVKTKHPTGVVLIVGHSNTVGPVVKGLGGSGDLTVDDDEYDSLFVVTTSRQGASSVRIKFGAETAKKD